MFWHFLKQKHPKPEPVATNQIHEINKSLKSPSIAFMQDPCPPPQDHWALQTSNLLQWGNLWPRPAAAPACGGNSKVSECCSFNVCVFSTCLSWIVQVILQLRERPDRAAKARRGLTLSLQPLKGFDYDSFLSPPSTPETQQDTGRQPQTAMALPGPALRLQAPQEKGPRREVFVWLGLQRGHHGQHFVCFTAQTFTFSAQTNCCIWNVWQISDW